MRSVVFTDAKLICSSPQCDWAAQRSESLDDAVLTAPEMTREKMKTMRAMVSGGSPVPA
jgi:hypothetical protein